MSNIICIPKPCDICSSRKNVQLFLGIMTCDICKESIILMNPHLSPKNGEIKEKTQE